MPVRSSRPQVAGRTGRLGRRTTLVGASVTQIEATIAKTVKLPVSVDERLRRYCFESRRTGQDVMLEAVRDYLDDLESRTKG